MMNTELPSLAPFSAQSLNKDIVWDLEQALAYDKKDEKNDILERYRSNSVDIKKYPFSGALGHAKQLKYLSKLLGIGGKGGHTVLLTGYRGIGKTSFVNQSIYDMSLLGYGRVDFVNDKNSINTDLMDKTKKLYENEKTLEYQKIDNYYDNFDSSKNRPGVIRLEKNLRTLLIDIRINVANPITIEELINRVIRQFYISLVENGISGIAPDIVKSARLAYIRTLGEINYEQLDKIKDIASTKAGIKITKDNIETSLGMEARKEIEIFRKISTILPKATLEESEDELLRIISLLDSSADKAMLVADKTSSVAKWLKKTMDLLNIEQLPDIEVSSVFVFDELDKLLAGNEQVFINYDIEKRASSQGSNPNIKTSLNYSVSESEIAFGKKYARAVSDIVYGMKQILSTGRASFIFISDEISAIAWQKEHKNKLQEESLLQTIFSEHIHLDYLNLNEIEEITNYYTTNNSRLESGLKNIKSTNGNSEQIINTSIESLINEIKTDIQYKNLIDCIGGKYLEYYIFYESLGIPKNIILTLRQLIKYNELDNAYMTNDFLISYLEKAVLGFYIYKFCYSEENLKFIKKNNIYPSQFLKFTIIFLDYLRHNNSFMELKHMDEEDIINPHGKNIFLEELKSLVQVNIDFDVEMIKNLFGLMQKKRGDIEAFYKLLEEKEKEKIEKESQKIRESKSQNTKRKGQ